MNGAEWTGVREGAGPDIGRHDVVQACGHIKRLKPWLLPFLAIMVFGFVAYLWNGLSVRALIRFDRTGLEPGEPGFGLPIDYGETWRCCLGLIGWIVGLGSFGLALIMALAVYRWPWPLRVITAAAPSALVLIQIVHVSDLHPWVRPVCLQIAVAEIVLAVLAGLLSRRIARLFPRRVAPN